VVEVGLHRAAIVGRWSRVIQGDDGTGDVIAAIGGGPAAEEGRVALKVVDGQEAVPLRHRLPEHDGIGKAVGHHGHGDLAAQAVEHAAQVLRVVRVAVHRAYGVSPLGLVAVDVERVVPADRRQTLGASAGHVVANPGLVNVVVVTGSPA